MGVCSNDPVSFPKWGGSWLVCDVSWSSIWDLRNDMCGAVGCYGTHLPPFLSRTAFLLTSWEGC